MNVERLRTLAEFLKTVPPSKFNLESWCRIDGGKVTDHIVKAGCGTVACAIGWCANIKEFREAGFGLRVVAGLVFPVFEGCEKWGAVVGFFDFGIGDAEYLFADWSYSAAERRDPLAVSKRISEFVGESA